MTTTKALSHKPTDEAIQAFDHIATIANDVSPAALAGMDDVSKALHVAKGLVAMKDALKHPACMGVLKSLQGTSLGFKTDKQYSDDDVARCALEAKIIGLDWNGNRFNIIGGNVYVTKNGAFDLVLGWPGVTDLRVDPYDIRNEGGSHVVKIKATWKLRGQPDEIDTEFVLKSQGSSGADFYYGKATRKVLMRVYEALTGKVGAVGDGEVEDMRPAPRRQVDNTAGGPGSGNTRKDA